MDSLTHIVLGACVGELVAGKQLGKRALLFGAAAQSLPDIDFVASPFLDASSDLIAHRGITHSWFFVVICTAFLVWASRKLFPKTTMTNKRWAMLWGFEMAIHLLLDACNVYGTAWWLPFSNERVAFNLLYVADPLFTIVPLIATLLLWWKRSPEFKRQRWARISLFVCIGYILLSMGHKHKVDEAVQQAAAEQQIPVKHFFSTPTPFNILMYYSLAETDSGYYVNYRSVFDKDKPDPFRFYPKNEPLLQQVRNQEEVKNLRLFSQGWYTVEKQNDTLVFNDLRFGQINGWKDHDAGFTFYYYLDRPDANGLVVQRGRLKNWNGDVVKEYVNRLFGMKK